MSFYLWAMRCASVILFVMAVLVIVGLVFSQGTMLLDSGSTSPYGPAVNWGFVHLVLTLAGALQSAALPLFGAALLWRIDRWHTNSAGGAK